MTSLGPQFLFHGTHRDIEGDRILPATQTPHSKNFDVSDPNVAYASENEKHAWYMGSQAGLMSANPYGGVMGRTRVHAVEKHPEAQMGAHHRGSEKFAGEDLSEWKAPDFKVTGRIDTMPGRQGTFPEINWNQFGKPQRGRISRAGDPLNHPTDMQIAEGHQGGSLYEESLAAYREANRAQSTKARERAQVRKGQGELW